jgi:drug/metabolite transporter (DMT)-like permease
VIRRFAALPPALRGGLWMMAAALSFTLMTTLIREAARDVHPFEIAFFRTVTNLVLMVPFVLRTGLAVLRTSNHRIYALRGVIGLTFLMTYFPGAALIPVSDAQALIFTSPLFASIMAVLFLGEVVRARRIAALIAGFAGALVILRPGVQDVSVGAVLVLVAAMANASSNVIVRHTTRSDHPDMAVLYLMIYVTPMSLVPALFVWTAPSWTQAALMVGVGVFATLNQRFLSRAFHVAEATAVLPFDFARLAFAAVIGWIAFSELPDIWVWVGGAIIFVASVYLAHRESVARRAGRA